MKKLTKVQREIESLAGKLPVPSDAFRKWDIRVRAQNNYKDTDEVYESFYSVSGKYAVERIFQVGKDYCNEVAQVWTNTESGRTHYRERNSTLIYGGNYGYRFLGYDESTPFHFKQKSGIEDNYGYRFCNPYQRGKASITKELERKGATQDDLDKFGVRILSKALADARMETILKHSYRNFYFLVHGNRKLTESVWSAYKITIRHKYTIRNMGYWYDMINEMDYLGMDTHNPKFVCPKAYKRLHDEVVEKAQRRREKERKAERERAEKERAERYKAVFEERMSRYGNLSFGNGKLHSVIMFTYEDYQEEGAAMHHCVGGYFDRKDSLIISMRDKDGKRVETVEVNLNNFTIVQSRGVCNNPTSHHQEIIDLVNANMWQIKECRNGKKLALAS